MAEAALTGPAGGAENTVVASPTGEQTEGNEATKQVKKTAPIPSKPARDIAREAAASRPVKNIPGLITRTSEPLLGARERNADGTFTKRDRNEDIEREMEARREDSDDDDSVDIQVARPPATPREVKPGEKPPLPAGATPQNPAASTGQKIKLGEKEYASLDEANQAHKSLQGMFKSQETRNKTLTEERDYGYKAANAWITEHDKARAENATLRKRIAELEGGSGTKAEVKAGAATPGAIDGLPSVEDILADFDGDAFEAIALHPNGGLPNAAKYLATEILKAISGKVLPAYDSRVNKRLEPFQASQEDSRLFESTNQIFADLALMKTHDGKMAFPEINDPEAMEAIGQAWRASGLPVEAARTPQGVMNAIAMYKMLKAMPTAESVAQAAVARVQPAPGPAASLAADEGGTLPPNSGRAPNMTPQQRRLTKAFRTTQLVDPKLGFTKNKRED